jgi:hypothetical protein
MSKRLEGEKPDFFIDFYFPQRGLPPGVLRADPQALSGFSNSDARAVISHELLVSDLKILNTT